MAEIRGESSPQTTSKAPKRRIPAKSADSSTSSALNDADNNSSSNNSNNTSTTSANHNSSSSSFTIATPSTSGSSVSAVPSLSTSLPTMSSSSSDDTSTRRFVGSQRMALNLGVARNSASSGATSASDMVMLSSGSATDRPAARRDNEALIGILSQMTPNAKREQILAKIQDLTPAEIDKLMLLQKSGKKIGADDSTLSSRARGAEFIDLRPSADGPKRKRASTLTHGINILRGNRNSDRNATQLSSSASSSPSLSPPCSTKKKRSTGLSRLWKSTNRADDDDDDDDDEGIPMYKGEVGVHGSLIVQESPFVERKPDAPSTSTSTTTMYIPRMIVNGFGWAVEEPCSTTSTASSTCSSSSSNLMSTPRSTNEPSLDQADSYPIEFREYDSTYYKTYFSTQGMSHSYSLILSLSISLSLSLSMCVVSILY
jgi:hypothetical protein